MDAFYIVVGFLAGAACFISGFLVGSRHTSAIKDVKQHVTSEAARIKAEMKQHVASEATKLKTELKSKA